MKKLYKLFFIASICTFSLIKITHALANPPCPSPSKVKNTQLKIAIQAKPGWYLTTDSFDAPHMVRVYLKARNKNDAFTKAKGMLQKLESSYGNQGILVGIDTKTGKNVYVCEYKPYANILVGSDDLPNDPFVAALFEANSKK